MNNNFSDFFEVPRETLKGYGALNISLIADTTAFIDPFLLYQSDDPNYRKAHDDMLKYMLYLCDRINKKEMLKTDIPRLLYFKEPCQNWLGYCEYGNGGNGLGKNFGNTLYKNLVKHMDSITCAKHSKSKHIEALLIFDDDFGKDGVSDFTTRLIFPFLLEYTQTFALQYISEEKCKVFNVEKAYFDYEKGVWSNKEYYLPNFNNDFVVLTPRDVLVHGDNYMCRDGLVEYLDIARTRIQDENFVNHFNSYFVTLMDKELTKAEKIKLAYQYAEGYPEIVDYYIQYKEQNGDSAKDVNIAYIKSIETVLEIAISDFIDFLSNETHFYSMPYNTYIDAFKRAKLLKTAVQSFESEIFTYNGRHVDNKSIVSFMFRVWHANNPKNATNVSGYKISFRCTTNSPVESVLSRFKDNGKGILCYISTCDKEIEKVDRISNKLDLGEKQGFIHIKACIE